MLIHQESNTKRLKFHGVLRNIFYSGHAPIGSLCPVAAPSIWFGHASILTIRGVLQFGVQSFTVNRLSTIDK